MKTTFQSRKDEVENIMLPSAASWAKSTPISLSNNRQFPALGQNAIELGIEPPVDLQLVVDEDHYSVLGSAILDKMKPMFLTEIIWISNKRDFCYSPVIMVCLIHLVVIDWLMHCFKQW
jgi:hypothetical protein